MKSKRRNSNTDTAGGATAPSVPLSRAGCGNSNHHYHHQSGDKLRISSSLWTIRLAFLFSLGAVAFGLAFLSHYLVSKSEQQVGEQQFETLASRALLYIKELRLRRRENLKSMAQIAATAFPDAATWPVGVAIPAFETVADDLIRTSDNVEMAFYPLVEPVGEEQEAWEDFALDFLHQEKGLGTSFGRGIWQRTGGGSTGSQRWQSNYTALFPELQNSRKGLGATAYLMLDIHAEPVTGKAIDQALTCSAKRRALQDRDMDCGVVTNITHWNRASYLVQPIYPLHDPFELTGVIVSLFSWDRVMDLVFTQVVASPANGVHVVLQSQGKSYTYLMAESDDNAADDKDGPRSMVQFIGQKDLHDPAMSKYAQGTTLFSWGVYSEDADGDGVTFSDASSSSSSRTTYQVTLYPTTHFFQVYTTKSPLVALVSALVAVVFTTLLFLLYDLSVRREFVAKQQLLQTKRKFMRFVSHEVRTPLNAVCMGLALVQEEVASALDPRNKPPPQQEQHSDGSIPSSIQKSRVGMPNEDETHCLLGSDGGNETMQPQQHQRLICHDKLQEWQALLGEVYGSAQNSVDVLNDLLNYDKIETGTLSLELTAYDIWKQILEASSEFRLSAKQKKIHFHLDLLNGSMAPPSTGGAATAAVATTNEMMNVPEEVKQLVVVADSLRITQVLRNLVSNAIKFTPEGGDVTVRASWTESEDKTGATDKFTLYKGEEIVVKKNGCVKIEVIDSGVGMSKEQLAELFRAGVQFNPKELQAGQGSGLGLYISKGIVAQHKGELKVSSPGLGHGTTFTCVLDLYRILSTTKEKEQSATSVTDTAAPSNAGTGNVEEEEAGHLRVLVVDDIMTNRKLLSRLIRNRGHITEEARDGQEAVDMILSAMEEGVKYDSILMDYEMPVMLGPDAVKEIRSRGCDAFVVGITGNVLQDDLRYFLSCGADAVLPKPIGMAQLEMLWSENGIFKAAAVSER